MNTYLVTLDNGKHVQLSAEWFELDPDMTGVVRFFVGDDLWDDEECVHVCFGVRTVERVEEGEPEGAHPEEGLLEDDLRSFHEGLAKSIDDAFRVPDAFFGQSRE